MKTNWLVVAMLGAASIGWAADKGPDALGYTATDNTVYSFINLVGGSGSASVLAGTDDDVALLTLPFPFSFYGRTFTLLCAGSNGLVTFVTSAAACTAGADFANTDLTSSATPGDTPAILPMWGDLTFQTAGAGAVYYATQGAPGSRRFVVEWANAYPQGSSNPMTFEVILYEGANKILFQYQSVDLGGGDPATKGGLATVGVRDTGGNTNSRQIAWSYNAAVLGNGSAILFSPTAGAQTSVNTITTSPAGLTVTIDGVPYATPKTVSWTPGSNHTLAVVSPLVNGGTRYTLTAWSTGAVTPQVSVTAGSTGTTYSANFTTEYQLTTGVNPASGGTLSGAGWYAAGSAVQVQAAASANYQFVSFSGDLSGSTNPAPVTMSAPKNVVANFQSTASPTLAAAVTGKTDAGPGQRTWTIRLSNTGAGTANSAQITSFVISQIAGTPCSSIPVQVTAMPVSVGTIAPGANLTGQVTIDFAGCSDTTGRFSAKINFSANGGSYQGGTTINNQTK